MYYLMLNLILVCSLSVYAANEKVTLHNQAVTKDNQLSVLIKDLVYNPKSSKSLEAYRSHLAAHAISYEEAYDALRPVAEGLNRLYALYKCVVDDQRNYQKITALLWRISNPILEHFVHFKEQIDAIPLHEDRCRYLEDVQARIAVVVDLHIESHKKHARQRAIDLASTRNYD